MIAAEEKVQKQWESDVRTGKKKLPIDQKALMIEMRSAGIKALFAHLIANVVVAGTGGGPSPVVGTIK